MTSLIQYIMIFFTSMIEIWVAIPTGFAFKLNPIIIFFVALLGACISSLIVLLLGERIQNWLLKHHNPIQKKESKICKIWHKYGVIGLGLLAPLLIGAPIGTAIGLFLKANPKKLFILITIGIIAWSLIITLICHFSIETIKMLIKH